MTYSQLKVVRSALHIARPDISECAACPIRGASVCSAVPDVDLSVLATSRRQMHFEKLQVVMRAGEPATHVFNVISGVVKLFRSSMDGRTQIIGFRGPGELFATSEMDRYSSTAEALTCVQVCRFPRSRFSELMEDYPDLKSRLLQMSCRQIAASEDHMFLLGRKNARERVASFLLVYGNRLHHERSECSPYANFPITRVDMADYLGLTVETVSRVIGSFVREKLITVGKSHSVNLIDAKTLGRIARIDGMRFGMYPHVDDSVRAQGGAGRSVTIERS